MKTAELADPTLPVPKLGVEDEKQERINQGGETNCSQVFGGVHLNSAGEVGDEGHQYCQHVDDSAGRRDEILQLQDQRSLLVRGERLQ